MAVHQLHPEAQQGGGPGSIIRAALLVLLLVLVLGFVAFYAVDLFRQF